MVLRSRIMRLLRKTLELVNSNAGYALIVAGTALSNQVDGMSSAVLAGLMYGACRKVDAALDSLKYDPRESPFFPIINSYINPPREK